MTSPREASQKLVTSCDDQRWPGNGSGDADRRDSASLGSESWSDLHFFSVTSSSVASPNATNAMLVFQKARFFFVLFLQFYISVHAMALVFSSCALQFMVFILDLQPGSAVWIFSPGLQS